MIKLQKQNGYKDVVYIDGVIIPRQVIPDNPRKKGNILAVDVISDHRVPPFIDYSKVNYQVKPLTKAVGKQGSLEITTLYLDATKIK